MTSNKLFSGRNRKYTPRDDQNGYMQYLRKLIMDVYPLIDCGRSKYATTEAVYDMVSKYWRHPELPVETLSIESVGIALSFLGLRNSAKTNPRHSSRMVKGWASRKTLDQKIDLTDSM